MLHAAAEDILTYMSFPTEHWRQIHPTNPLERLNRETACRRRGHLPQPRFRPAPPRAVLAEQNDEWTAAPRRYFSQESMAKTYASGISQPNTLPALNPSN
jgi:putative transposase